MPLQFVPLFWKWKIPEFWTEEGITEEVSVYRIRGWHEGFRGDARFWISRKVGVFGDGGRDIDPIAMIRVFDDDVWKLYVPIKNSHTANVNNEEDSWLPLGWHTFLYQELSEWILDKRLWMEDRQYERIQSMNIDGWPPSVFDPDIF